LWVKRWSFSWLTEAGAPDVHWVNPSQYAWRNGASLETLCTAIRREWKICCINIVGMRWFVELWFAQYRASNDIDRRRFLWELNQLKSSSHILLLHRYEKQIRQCTSYPKKHSKRRKIHFILEFCHLINRTFAKIFLQLTNNSFRKQCLLIQRHLLHKNICSPSKTFASFSGFLSVLYHFPQNLIGSFEGAYHAIGR